jgi:hypothetical protein
VLGFSNKIVKLISLANTQQTVTFTSVCLIENAYLSEEINRIIIIDYSPNILLYDPTNPTQPTNSLNSELN